MSLHTPVVFSNDPGVQRAARDRDWLFVETHPDNPKVLRLFACETPCGLPQARMSVATGSLDAGSTPVWNYVLNWLDRFVHRPLLLLSSANPLIELALWASATRDWPIGVLLHDGEPAPVEAAGQALVSTACGSWTVDGSGPILGRGVAQQLPELPSRPLVDIPKPHRSLRSDSADGTTRLLVAAYSATVPGLSPQASFPEWAQEVAELSGGRIAVELVHASPGLSFETGMHHVPDLAAIGLTTGSGAFPAWAAELLDYEASLPWSPALLPGGLWRWQLQRYFEDREDQFDVVLCIGQPLGTFDFASWAKRRWYARCILAQHGREVPATDPMILQEQRRVETGWFLNGDAFLFSGGAPSPRHLPEQNLPIEELAPGDRNHMQAFVDLVLRLGDHSFRPASS